MTLSTEMETLSPPGLSSLPSSLLQAETRPNPQASAIDFSVIDSDNGQPSSSLHSDLLRVLQLIVSERHLVALSLLHSIEERFNAPGLLSDDHNGDGDSARDMYKDNDRQRLQTSRRNLVQMVRKKESSNSSEIHNSFDERLATLRLMKDKKKDLDDLKQRCSLFQSAIMDQSSEGWTFSQTLFGVSTFYRRESDGSLTIKLEGQLNDVPLFEQLSILREVDLWNCWAPFCTESRNLAQLGNIDMIGWLVTGAPKLGLSRDLCFRAVGCDSLREHGKIILVAQGIGNDTDSEANHSFLASDPLVQQVPIPPVPTRLGSGRMILRKFEAIVDVLSPSSAQTRIITNVDPNFSFLPHSILDFVMRKMCGVLLNHLQSAALKLSRNPDKTPYAKRIRSDPFYEFWLLPKFQHFCMFKGWAFPTIKVLETTSILHAMVATSESSTQVITYGDLSTNKIEKQDTPTSPQANEQTNYGKHLNPLFKRRVRKELELAQSREFNLNRLRPTQFKEEQLSRLKSLRQVKENILRPDSSIFLSDDYEKVRYLNEIEDFLTGVKPFFSHKKMIGGLLSILFLIFYGVSDEKQYLFDISNESKDNPSTRWSIRCFQLVTFGSLYFILVTRTLIAIFDNLELPGTSKISNEKALPWSRKLFTNLARTGCVYSLAFHVVISCAHGAIRVALSGRILGQGKTLNKASPRWDDIAIDDIKLFMSYCSVFMISLFCMTNIFNAGAKLKLA